MGLGRVRVAVRVGVRARVRIRVTVTVRIRVRVRVGTGSELPVLQRNTWECVCSEGTMDSNACRDLDIRYDSGLGDNLAKDSQAWAQAQGLG